MQQAFLIIISILGAIYALFTKQFKMAAGFFIVGISFVFAIPSLASGVRADVFGAITMILFALGIFVIVFKKKAITPEENQQEKNE